MSDEVIYSDDCTVEMLVSDIYYPILCQSEMRFRLQQEVILKTGVNSGLFKEKTTRLSEGFASVSGLSPVNNGTNISVLYILQEAVRTQPQSIRFVFTDQAGVSKQISGSVVIVSCETGMAIGDFLQATIEMEFTGGITIDTVTPPSGAGSNLIYSDTWDFAGSNYVSGTSKYAGYSLIGKTIIEVDREGTQFDLIADNTTPGNRECSWFTATNRLVFKDDFNIGETVFIIFQ